MEEEISPDLIQVNATMKEINERIEQFIRFKRTQANASNVLDFCGPLSLSQCCARVDAVLVRKKDSSSHMAVRNVLDRYTSKYKTSKVSSNKKSSNVIANSHKLHLESKSQFLQPNKDQQDLTTLHKGNKRTYDVALLESMLDTSISNKQQNTKS